MGEMGRDGRERERRDAVCVEEDDPESTRTRDHTSQNELSRPPSSN